jgi:acetylornithine deacetylase
MAVTDCVKLLRQLIAHRTVNPGGDEPALARHLAELLEGRGADRVEVTEVARDGETGAYCWATYGEPDVLVNVHIDTVPVASGWTRDPFELTAEGDRLYGLGAADTKGAIAALLSAIDQRRPENLAILLSGDEERTTSCMSHFLASGRAAPIRRAIVCEPTARHLGVGHRGIRAYRLEIPGVGGHSSRADSTPKPLITASRLALDLDELGESYLDPERGPSRGPRTGDGAGLCLNVAEIGGGVPFNVIPQRGELLFSIRPAAGFDAERWGGELGTCLRTAGSGITAHPLLTRDPFATRDPGWFHALLGRFPGAATQLDFWTEAAMLAGAGIDAVVIGPGDIAVAHGPDEFVPAGDLEWAEAMFVDLFARLG